MDEINKLKDLATSVLVFTVPGSLFLFLLSELTMKNFQLLSDIKNLYTNPIFFLFTSYAIGLISYAHWTVIFRTFCGIFNIKTLSPDDVDKIYNSNLKKMIFTYEQDFRLYQLYGSITITLIIFLIESFFINSSILKQVVLLSSLIVCLINSIFCYIVFRNRMLKFIKHK